MSLQHTTFSQVAARTLILLTFAFVCVLTARAQTTWTERNSASGGSLLWGVAEGNSGLVAVGGEGRILHSTDGKTWERRTSGTSVWLVAVTYGLGQYYAVGDQGTILRSADGREWTAVSSTGTTARLNNILYAQNRFVAVGERGTIVVSDDGKTWSATTSGVTGWLHGLAHHSGYWITTGQSGAISTSRDGLTWTSYSSGTTAHLEAVSFVESYEYRYTDKSVYRSRYFVAVGSEGKVILASFGENTDSSGAVTYSSFYAYPQYSSGIPSTVRLGSLAMYDKVLLAIGNDGAVYTAKGYNGSWSRIVVDSQRSLNAAGFGQGSLFLLGNDESIYQSEPIFPSRLGNISTRGQVADGANVMIAGTIVTGTLPKQFVVRGVGPSLSKFGLTGLLTDPKLTVYDQSGKPIASNAGWEKNASPQSVAEAMSSVGAFSFSAGSKDSALVISLNPGAYTFMLQSAGGASKGLGMVEVYDMDPLTADGSRAINISTRGLVGTDDKVLIAGVIVQGPSARTLLIRGVGPTMATTFNLGGVLENPKITVFQADGTPIASNDDWGTTATYYGREVTADHIRAANSATGAFPLDEKSKDAALILTLAPGVYTVHVAGVNNSSGLALVEAYEVPSN